MTRRCNTRDTPHELKVRTTGKPPASWLVSSLSPSSKPTDDREKIRCFYLFSEIELGFRKPPVRTFPNKSIGSAKISFGLSNNAAFHTVIVSACSFVFLWSFSQIRKYTFTIVPTLTCDTFYYSPLRKIVWFVEGKSTRESK